MPFDIKNGYLKKRTSRKPPNSKTVTVLPLYKFMSSKELFIKKNTSSISHFPSTIKKPKK